MFFIGFGKKFKIEVKKACILSLIHPKNVYSFDGTQNIK